MIAWLLVMYIGGHSGYLQQGDLASEQACRNLYRKMVETNLIYSTQKFECLPYEKAVSNVTGKL